jgi:hypothetical protein
MNKTVSSLVQRLKTVAFQFDAHAEKQKTSLLQSIAKQPIKGSFPLMEYHELLLFMAAYPESKQLEKIVKSEFERITKTLKTAPFRSNYLDSGLPFTEMQTRFSHDMLQYLNQDKQCEMTIDSFEEAGTDLNTLLRFTLPSVEREETTAGLDNIELLSKLGVHENANLSFLLNEFSRFNTISYVKDHLWESLKVFINFRFKHRKFSKTWNRLLVKSTFYSSELLKKFDHQALIQSPLPFEKSLNAAERSATAKVIKRSLTLTMRETDPSTYMDESTLKVYELERGVTIAIYGMNADRQLPFQSYIGYTLFKNGIPTAYGGSWMFGKVAMFGLNIFETFRGSESGYMMCQLLRVYIHVFSLTYVEVEAYQFGLDNPDGIRSGAFWFYYRYGFRPIDKTLNTLANKEFGMIQSKPGYRSSEKVLLRFTESNIELQLANHRPIKHIEIAAQISNMINKRYKGNRLIAEQKCIEWFIQKTKLLVPLNPNENQVLKEVALWANAFDINDKKQLGLMVEMIRIKPICPYAYNELLTKFFA